MTQSRTIVFSGPIADYCQIAGAILARLCSRMGWQVYGQLSTSSNQSYDFQLTIADQPVTSIKAPTDLLISFNTDDGHEVVADGLVIVDQKSTSSRRKTRTITLPVQTLAREIGNHPRTSVSVVLGAAAAGLDVSLAKLLTLVGEAESDNPMINAQAITAGFKAVQSQNVSLELPKLVAKSTGMAMNGHQALALGLIASGAKYCAIEASSQLESLVGNLQLQQATAALVIDRYQHPSMANQAIGAAMAGTRAVIVTTSLAELAPSYALAASSETPVVFLSFTADQSGLQSTLHLANDLPMITICPANPQQCFSLIQEAFNLAEMYQTPAIVIVNQAVADNLQTTSDLTGRIVPINRGALLTARQAAASSEYQRYQTTPNHISPRKVPGQPGQPFATSVYDSSDNRTSNQPVRKRLAKMANLLDHTLPYQIHGPATAQVTLICYGSLTNPAIEAMNMLSQTRIIANVLQLLYLEPFPVDQISQVIRHSRHLLLVEAAATAQLSQLISQKTNIALRHQFTSTEPIVATDIVVAVRQKLTNSKRRQK